MATYNWPSDEIRPSSMKVSLVSNTQTFRSKFSGAVQTTRAPGSHWKFDMTFERSLDSESRKLEALLVKLDGMAHRVRVRDFGRDPVPANGNPLVSLANQQGESLQTKGWTPNARALEEGQWFTVNGELKMATDTVNADASGNATIKFGPALRRSPALNAKIDTVNTYGVFLLTTNDNGVDRAPAFRNGFSFSLEEDITI